MRQARLFPPSVLSNSLTKPIDTVSVCVFQNIQAEGWVLSVDRSKILHQAQLLASKGQYDAALSELRKLSAEFPHDGSIHNTIGDLHLKRNANAEAIGAFLQAASGFRADGATLKAIAAYKKILKIDPTRYEVYRHLGDLNAERGLLSSAVQDYLTIGKHYLKEGRGKEALEIYRKIVEQDPTNFDAQQRVAELCIQENQQDEATKVYLQLGRERSAQGRFDEARDAYLAVLRIDPKNSEAEQFVASMKQGGAAATKPVTGTGSAKSTEPLDLLGEATRRIHEKQFAGAEAILNQLLTREPGNPQVCQLLARLHLQRGDIQVALGEYRFLAGAALRAQDLRLAESLITEFLEVQPQSVSLLELFGELHEARGDGAAAALQYAKAVELLLEHPEPGMESLHEELFEKAKALATDRALIDRLAARIAGEPILESGAGLEGGERPGPAEQTESTGASVEPGEFRILGAEPDGSAWASTGRTHSKEDRASAASESASGLRMAKSEGDPEKEPAAQAEQPVPAGIRELCGLVESAISDRRYRDAEHLMARWLSQEPNNCEARALLGCVYEAKGDTAGAALQYARALELFTAQSGQQQTEWGQSLYEKVKTLAPSSPVLVRLAATMASAPLVETPDQPQADESPAPQASLSAAVSAEEPPSAADSQEESEAETRYALGVAYKNMGLYQEAVEEFQLAMTSDTYYLDSCLMMALCFKEERQFAQAICMLEPILYDPRSQSAKGQAIRYELGLLYEAEAQWEDAARTYQSIPSFHDVPQRLSSIRDRHQPPAEGLRLAG
jgi:tetratricopeptide (TPR) repeat protein